MGENVCADAGLLRSRADDLAGVVLRAEKTQDGRLTAINRVRGVRRIGVIVGAAFMGSAQALHHFPKPFGLLDRIFEPLRQSRRKRIHSLLHLLLRQPETLRQIGDQLTALSRGKKSIQIRHARLLRLPLSQKVNVHQ